MNVTLSNLCSLIGPYIHLYAFIYSRFCDLRKPPARCCIHLFLTSGRVDRGGYITNDNGRLISGQRDRRGSWFSFTILADHTLHACLLLVFLSGSQLSRAGSYAVITITRRLAYYGLLRDSNLLDCSGEHNYRVNKKPGI